jgi:phage-related protein
MALTSNVKVSSADKFEGTALIVLLIAVAGFFIVYILTTVDNVISDIVGDFANFPGLKQLLTLLGTIANAFTKLFSWIGGVVSTGSGGGSSDD